MLTSYKPQEEESPSFRTVRFTVTDSNMLSVIREIERREAKSIDDIGYQALVNELFENYQHYTET